MTVMTSMRQVIGDSDDDEDSVILLRSPQGNTQRGGTSGESSSTDPSFFWCVYEEQHKELRPPSDTTRRTTDGAHHKTQSDDGSIDGEMRGEEGQVVDLWDVPSSPEAVDWHGTKRKRDGSHQPDDGTIAQVAGQRLQILISAAGGTDSATAASRKKRREEMEQAQEQERGYTATDNSFSSIEPTDPSGLGQLHLLGSSSSAVQHRLPGDLNRMQGPIGYDGDYERTLPASAAVTESTIAYPTPSRYAVLNPHHMGGGNDGAAQYDHLHDSPQATPTRPRAGLLSEILPSSPDEIAAPFTALGQGRPPVDDAWEPHDSHIPHHSTVRPTNPKKRRASDTDELSSAAAYMTEHNPVVSEADRSTADITGEENMPAKAESKKKKREQGKKKKAKEVIDLSDYNDADPLTDAPPAAVTTNAGATSSKPKRPRGRPKRQTVATEPPPQEPTEEGQQSEPSRGEMGKEKQEQPQKQTAVPTDSADPADPGTSSTASVAPVTATVPVKKPISSIRTGQGRVPFRVGLSKRHRIAPLLKSMPRP